MMFIYVCRGLPASGKSTKAKYLVGVSTAAKNKQACRLSKDSLREMLHNGVYSKENEILVRDIWRDTIKNCIRHERTLIVDDCNLNPLHIQSIREIARVWSKEYKVRVMIKYLDFRTDIETCIKRDKRRSNPVGEKAIRDMAKRFDWQTLPRMTFWDRIKSLLKGSK